MTGADHLRRYANDTDPDVIDPETKTKSSVSPQITFDFQTRRFFSPATVYEIQMLNVKAFFFLFFFFLRNETSDSPIRHTIASYPSPVGVRGGGRALEEKTEFKFIKGTRNVVFKSACARQTVNYNNMFIRERCTRENKTLVFHRLVYCSIST